MHLFSFFVKQMKKRFSFTDLHLLLLKPINRLLYQPYTIIHFVPPTFSSPTVCLQLLLFHLLVLLLLLADNQQKRLIKVFQLKYYLSLLGKHFNTLLTTIMEEISLHTKNSVHTLFFQFPVSLHLPLFFVFFFLGRATNARNCLTS